MQEGEVLGEEERDKGMEEEGKSWEAVAIAMSACVGVVCVCVGGEEEGEEKLWRCLH